MHTSGNSDTMMYTRMNTASGRATATFGSLTRCGCFMVMK